MKSMSQKYLTVIGGYMRLHWRRAGLLGLAGLATVLIIVQLAYPWSKLPLYQTIDGVDVSGWDMQDAIVQLDGQYKAMSVAIYFGQSPKPYRQPTTGELGMTVQSQRQVESARYPWWLRLVPSSLWWVHGTINPEPPAYVNTAEEIRAYMDRELGASCDVKPVNATLEYKDDKLQVVPAIDGGTCKPENVEKLLLAATPTLKKSDIRIPMTERPAAVHDEQAREVADGIMEQTKQGVAMKVGSQVVTIPQREFLSWLQFAAPDSGVAATVSQEKPTAFFDKQLLPKVAVTPGVSRVTTLDFAEVSRTDGAAGRTLDRAATVAVLNEWLKDAQQQPVAQTKTVPPTISYTRTYTPTDTGLNALITQFSEDHSGTFGVSFAELDGKRRHAAYQKDKAFRTASTYKLFVAYGALKRVESGAWSWSDQIHGGRTLAKCLDDMIVKSDNPCGEVMLEKIGYRTLTNELRAIGLGRSSFLGEYPETTAGDLTTFVGALQSKQLLSGSNTELLLSAMKRNVYRQGIPAGGNGTVANKVGFLDAYLHDAAIIYSPSGTYALTVMTNGSSWAMIAELTREIEKLRVSS